MKYLHATIKLTLSTLLLLVGLLESGISSAAGIGHPTFLSPHASPITRTGEHLWVANTPADTVDVIAVSNMNIVARIPVGIDPVGMAVRPDGLEVWVSNHVSDSVSVIDSDPNSPTWLNVIATVQDLDPVTRATRFDEPVGIAFADNDKAYVALSSENQIAVINVASREVVNKLSITAQDPRAIKVKGDRLYVIPFESNNKTQISGCVGQDNNTSLCTFDATEHVVTNNNVLSAGIVVDIVKNFKVPDRDLYVFDTGNDQLVEVVNTLGTLLYGLTIDNNGRVFVAQTDARNDVNGRAGTMADGLLEMDNRAFLNQLTRLECGGFCGIPQFYNLEPLPPVNPAPGKALATPYAIEISSNDMTLVATAAGSNKLFTMDANSGTLMGEVAVGNVPRGIALESDQTGAPLQAWVYNAADNSISVVNLSSPANPMVTHTIILEDPTHPQVKAGRIAFNNAGASTSGTYSCESCHPDGGTDQLLWILDTPICSEPGCTQIPPRITMPIRGLRDTAPYHWDGIPGDPYGGINTANIRTNVAPNCDINSPESCTLNLVDAGLASTMCEVGNCPFNEAGKSGALTAAERDDMAKFLLSVPYPPAQRRAYDNVLSSRAAEGFQLFHIDGDLQGDPQPNVCGDCHRMPFWVSTNTPGTGMEAPTWRGAYDRWLILPQGRLNIIDFNFFEFLTRAGIPEKRMWRLSWAGRQRFDPVWDMVLEGSTGFDGAFARNLTVNQSSAESAQTTDMLDAMELAAANGSIHLEAEGVFLAEQVATPVQLKFDHQIGAGAYIQKGDNWAAYSRAELISLAAEGSFIGTLTARLGVMVDVDHPQPAIWSDVNLPLQRGRQIFPTLSGDETNMLITGRHIAPGARTFVDGVRVPGTVSCRAGELADCPNDKISVALTSTPQPAGMHFLQVQNPDGLTSNDYIIHTNNNRQDNCPDIPNPEQLDSDGDGVGDSCDDDAFDFAIDAGISGSWFDPDHAGEGWFVEVLNENTALVFWFSYAPPGVSEGQSWIVGTGEIIGSSIVVSANQSTIAKGAEFGAGFDPDRVARRPWGKFTLSFSSCDEGVMYYQSEDADYGHGSLKLSRLTNIEGLACGAPVLPATQNQSASEFVLSAAISGAWYDPAHDGEGWVIEMLENGRAVLVWFSYDSHGNQAWFINAGEADGNSLKFDLLVPSGTQFGPTFNPASISRPVWGEATLSFDSCNAGSMTFDSALEGYGAGTLQLERLSSLAGHSCD